MLFFFYEIKQIESNHSKQLFVIIINLLLILYNTEHSVIICNGIAVLFHFVGNFVYNVYKCLSWKYAQI